MYKRFNDLSIKTKLLVSCIAVILICILVFSITVFFSSQRYIQKETQYTVQQTVSLAEEITANYMNDIENMLFAIQSNKNIRSILTNGLHSNANSMQLLENTLLSVDIYNRKTTAIRLYLPDLPDQYASQGSDIVLDKRWAENETWYKNTVNAGGLTCWTVFHATKSSGFITASRQLIDTNTYLPIGVLRIDISILQFTSILNDIQLGETGSVFLVSQNHIVNVSNKKNLDVLVNDSTFMKLLKNDIIDTDLIKINGVRYLISYKNLNNSQLKVVGSVRYSELNQSTNSLAAGIFLISLLSLLVIILMLAIVSKTITDPIYRLANTMDNYTGGENIELTIPSNNEIGVLYRSFNRMVNTIHNLILDVNTLYEKQKISELKALQAQINPHFLYNTLDSINWMAKKYKANDISLLATSLGNFFRRSLNHGRDFTTIKNELEQIKSYVYIQKVRFKDTFDLYISVDDDILTYSIVKLTLQPLVENCIIHGFEDIDYKGIIEITGYRKENKIILQVIDNGCGTDTEKLNKQVQREFNPQEPIEKYGLHNVNQRIKLYFNQTCGLYFETNEDGGVTATVTIEVKEL